MLVHVICLRICLYLDDAVDSFTVASFFKVAFKFRADIGLEDCGTLPGGLDNAKLDFDPEEECSEDVEVRDILRLDPESSPLASRRSSEKYVNQSVNFEKEIPKLREIVYIIRYK